MIDGFVRYGELTDHLHELAARRPDLVEVESIGHSHEGRDIWLVTITDHATGPAAHKPAHWIDANIHATELTAGAAALAVVDGLVARRDEPDIAHALATRAFYIVPRVNPDGVEAVLADSPRHLRSSVRYWPWTDGHRWPGLDVCDVDGDGRILTMRVPDPDGAWVADDVDPRLMVPRPAHEPPGRRPAWRLLQEGVLTDFDGWTVPTPRDRSGLDLNRNYPFGWRRSTTGAGDYPGGEPEIAALLGAIRARPNICGANAMHTHGGVLLRPLGTQGDESLDPFDKWVFEALGAAAQTHTGYPVHSGFEDFTWDKSDPMAGASDDWAYCGLGVYAWTTELWDVVFRATGQRASKEAWYVGESADVERAVLSWCSQHWPDRYYEPWRPFQHPQLGAIEIGGWDVVALWVNAPASLLEAEVGPHVDVAVHQALCSPALTLAPQLHALGDGLWRVEARVANTGWLATDVSALARKQSMVLPGTVSVVPVDARAEVIDGPSRRTFGQLEGRAAMRFSERHDGTPDRTMVAFTVRGERGAVLSIVADHPRAGRVECAVTLED